MLLLKKFTLALVLALVTACGTVPPAMPAASFITSEDSPVGTWTPTVGGTSTYTNQVGTYTKIGKLVTVFCRMSIATIGTGSPYIITGFPYPIDLDPFAYAIAPVYVNGLALSVVNVVGLLGPNGTTSMSLYSLTAAATGMSGNSILGNGSDVYFSLSYLTP